MRAGENMDVRIQPDRLAETFAALVAIDSPSYGERQMADELTRRLRALGLTVEEVEVLLSNGFTERDLDDMAVDREYLEECRAMCF